MIQWVNVGHGLNSYRLSPVDRGAVDRSSVDRGTDRLLIVAVRGAVQ